MVQLSVRLVAAIFADEEMDWQGACVERERSFRVWAEPEQYMEHFVFNDYLFAAVDVVHLMQVGGVMGTSRNRSTSP